MFTNSARRFSLVLTLGVLSLIAARTTRADGTTGTDPCPKGVLCSNSTKASTPGPPVSTTGTVLQVALILLGIS